MEVVVHGQPGVLRELPFGRMLIWKEEGVLFSMFHSGKLRPEELLAVAESLQQVGDLETEEKGD